MKLTVTKQAAEWFKENLGFSSDSNSGIRFKAKIYGSSPVNDAFAIAMEPNTPLHPIAEFTSENGIKFYIEESDEWFFHEHDLKVAYDETLEEPRYLYIKDGQAIN